MGNICLAKGWEHRSICYGKQTLDPTAGCRVHTSGTLTRKDVSLYLRSSLFLRKAGLAEPEPENSFASLMVPKKDASPFLMLLGWLTAGAGGGGGLSQFMEVLRVHWNSAGLPWHWLTAQDLLSPHENQRGIQGEGDSAATGISTYFPHWIVPSLGQPASLHSGK